MGGSGLSNFERIGPLASCCPLQHDALLLGSDRASDQHGTGHRHWPGVSSPLTLRRDVPCSITVESSAPAEGSLRDSLASCLPRTNSKAAQREPALDLAGNLVDPP